MKEQIQDLLDIAPRTYYLWKKDGRPIINFLEKYFDENDLSEFLETGSVSKLESINYFLYQQSSLFFDFYDSIDGSIGAWRLLHIQLLSESEYKNENVFFNNLVLRHIEKQSEISNLSIVTDFSICAKIIKELTPPVLQFINFLKKDDFKLIFDSISHKLGKDIASLYVAAFKLRSILAVQNLTIPVENIDETIMPEEWIKVRKAVLYNLKDLLFSPWEDEFVAKYLEIVVKITAEANKGKLTKITQLSS